MTIKITNEIQSFWNKFIDSNASLEYQRNYKLDAWSFGNTSAMADELSSLVMEGKKTATCSLHRAYKGEEIEIPRVGVYSILCDGNELPLCIVYLTDTFITKYNEVTQKHAFEEGEGDRTLSHWKIVHFNFFKGYEGFTEEDELICERFKVVYK
jgi:uncharacterized protein YhfF